MILGPLHSFFLCPQVKTPVISYSPHSTTLHKPADQDSSLLDITVSLLDGRKGVRKDEGSKVNLRAKGGKIPPKKDQKRWEEGISYTSGYNHVPIFLPRYAILPCSSSFKVVGQTMARQAGDIRACTEGATAHYISPDYQALTHTQTSESNVSEEGHQNLRQET